MVIKLSYQLVERAKHGHNVTTTYPALSPLKIKEDFTRRLQGISLKGVEISCKLNKRKKISKRGDMLFSHFGITGPVVLIISSYINKLLEKEPVELTIDCVRYKRRGNKKSY